MIIGIRHLKNKKFNVYFDIRIDAELRRLADGRTDKANYRLTLLLISYYTHFSSIQAYILIVSSPLASKCLEKVSGTAILISYLEKFLNSL